MLDHSLPFGAQRVLSIHPVLKLKDRCDGAVRHQHRHCVTDRRSFIEHVPTRVAEPLQRSRRKEQSDYVKIRVLID